MGKIDALRAAYEAALQADRRASADGFHEGARRHGVVIDAERELMRAQGRLSDLHLKLQRELRDGVDPLRTCAHCGALHPAQENADVLRLEEQARRALRVVREAQDAELAHRKVDAELRQARQDAALAYKAALAAALDVDYVQFL